MSTAATHPKTRVDWLQRKSDAIIVLQIVFNGAQKETYSATPPDMYFRCDRPRARAEMLQICLVAVVHKLPLQLLVADFLDAKVVNKNLTWESGCAGRLAQSCTSGTGPAIGDIQSCWPTATIVEQETLLNGRGLYSPESEVVRSGITLSAPLIQMAWKSSDVKGIIEATAGCANDAPTSDSDGLSKSASVAVAVVVPIVVLGSVIGFLVWALYKRKMQLARARQQPLMMVEPSHMQAVQQLPANDILELEVNGHDEFGFHIKVFKTWHREDMRNSQSRVH
ncbi:hypothetical protein IWZ03DRAFT_357878 [Phyllosticta citriasiana]|uniref:Uncharacterized protein n=1 Tax=Phyllosticta citriasiana TaxID=595635 RepID=A0ABR1KWU8_9PEZI